MFETQNYRRSGSESVGVLVRRTVSSAPFRKASEFGALAQGLVLAQRGFSYCLVCADRYCGSRESLLILLRKALTITVALGGPGGKLNALVRRIRLRGILKFNRNLTLERSGVAGFCIFYAQVVRVTFTSTEN